MDYFQILDPPADRQTVLHWFGYRLEFIMHFKLLVGSQEFWPQLQSDIEAARKSICVQTLSFEADEAGTGLSEAIRASGAADRRIIVDRFTRHFISDRWVFSPRNRLNKAHRSEVVGTREMFGLNGEAGVKVKWVNPFGFLYHKASVRNHKKMILIDERIAYIGGINFSDHNFEWHDMMIRIDDPEVAQFMQADFDNTWEGRDIYSRGAFDGIVIRLIDGNTNEQTFSEVFDLIDSANESIFIESPYLSWPFWDYLRSAVERGVDVTILMPADNNRSWVQWYTTWEAARSGINLRYYMPKMTHLKSMLIDERLLIVGSSNFDYYSYRTQQEVVAAVTDEELVSEFIERVRDVDLAQSRAVDTSEVRRSTVVLYGFIRVMGKLTTTLAKL